MNNSSNPFGSQPSFDPTGAGAGAPPGEGATAAAAPGHQQPNHFPNSAHSNHFAMSGSKENQENGAVSLFL